MAGIVSQRLLGRKVKLVDRFDEKVYVTEAVVLSGTIMIAYLMDEQGGMHVTPLLKVQFCEKWDKDYCKYVAVDGEEES